MGDRRKITVIAISAVLFAVAVLFFLTVPGARNYSVDFSAISTSDDGNGHFQLQLRGISLRKGSYDIDIGYVSDCTSDIVISLGNDVYIHGELSPSDVSGGAASFHADLVQGTDRGRIDIGFDSGSQVNLAYININSPRPLYYDGLILGILMLLLIPFVPAVIGYFKRSPRKMSLLFVTGLVLIQVVPFILQSGIHLGVDARSHMMRVEGIYYGLLDGQFPAIIYPEWNNSYGQPGALYPNLFLYIPALLRLLGMSQLTAYKLFLIVIIILTAISAYAAANSIFGHEWQTMLAVSLICLDNMHLLNLLEKGRMGGALLAEMFYPLVVAGLVSIFYKDRKKWHYLAFGIAGIGCCHIMSATIVLLAVILFTVCSAPRLKERAIYAAVGKAVLLAAGLALGPATAFIKFYFSDWGQERLQWSDFITKLFPMGSFEDDKKWIYSIVLLLSSVTALAVVIIKKRYAGQIKGTFVLSAIICAAILFVSSTALFPWGTLRNIPFVEYYTNMVQTAYRVLSLSDCMLAFCIPVLLSAFITSVEEKSSYRGIIITAGVIAGILCTLSYATAYYKFFCAEKQMLYYDRVLGEVEMQQEDYLPAGTKTEWYESDSGYISDEEATGSIDYKRDGTRIFYSYTNSKEGSYVEFPRFYYDGYAAVDELSESVPVYKGDRNRTRIYLSVTDTPKSVTMWYKVPWYLTVTFVFSVLLWIGAAVVFLLDNASSFRYNFKCYSGRKGS